jgi:hypothetical protein
VRASAANANTAGADPAPHDPVNVCGHRNSQRHRELAPNSVSVSASGGAQ